MILGACIRKGHPLVTVTSLKPLRDEVVILSSVGKRDVINNSTDLPLLDKILAEMEKRFNAENLQIFRGLATTDPNFEYFLNFETIIPMANNYKIDLEDLELEFSQVQRDIKKHNASLKNVKEFDAFIIPQSIAFPELCKILNISPTAECERSFSKQKLINTHIRNTMLDQRLKSLSIISIHRVRAMNIEFIDVVDRFVKRFPNIMLDLV